MQFGSCLLFFTFLSLFFFLRLAPTETRKQKFSTFNCWFACAKCFHLITRADFFRRERVLKITCPSTGSAKVLSRHLKFKFHPPSEACETFLNDSESLFLRENCLLKLLLFFLLFRLFFQVERKTLAKTPSNRKRQEENTFCVMKSRFGLRKRNETSALQKSMCNYMWNISEPSFEAEVNCETRERSSPLIF